jgi:hypothetical protein
LVSGGNASLPSARNCRQEENQTDRKHKQHLHDRTSWLRMIAPFALSVENS